MLLILIAITYDLFTKSSRKEIRIQYISLLGIAMFLLIWEARSRYIYFLIPILCILGAMGLNNLSNDIMIKEKIEKLKYKLKGRVK